MNGGRPQRRVSNLARRPAALNGRNDLGWIEALAHQRVVEHLHWWERTNPRWIERHLDPSSCRTNAPSGLDPTQHRVTCCQEHAEVDERIDAIADILLLYPFLTPATRSTRFRLLDELFPSLFLAWFDSSERPSHRRLPDGEINMLQQAAFDQAMGSGRRRYRAEGLAWIDTAATVLLPRHMEWWHDIESDVLKQHLTILSSWTTPYPPPWLDAEIIHHLEEIGLLLMLTTFAGPGRRERIGIWTSLDRHLEPLWHRWLTSKPTPHARFLVCNDVLTFQSEFGRINPYEVLFN